MKQTQMIKTGSNDAAFFMDAFEELENIIEEMCL